MVKKRVGIQKNEIILFSVLFFISLISFVFDDKIKNLFLGFQSNTSFIFLYFGILMSILTNWIFLSFLAFFLILFYFYKNRKKAVNLFFSYSLALFLTGILKLIFLRQRPLDLSNWNSFPSGHAAFVFAPVLFFKGTQRKVMICFALLVALSRIYLMEHYLSDILFGLLIGLSSGYFIKESKIIEKLLNKIKKNKK